MYVNWQIHSIVLVSILISGCFQPDDDGITVLPDPETVESPVWKAGDRWNYRDQNERWENWSVEGWEMVREVVAYRVRLDYSTPDEFGSDQSLIWLDKESLGMVRFRQDSWSGWADVPMSQSFPIGNRSYNGTMHTDPGSPVEFHEQVSIEGWKRITVPAGEFDTISISVQDMRLGHQEMRFYSPDVGNFVRRSESSMYDLVSWERVE